MEPVIVAENAAASLRIVRAELQAEIQMTIAKHPLPVLVMGSIELDRGRCTEIRRRHGFSEDLPGATIPSHPGGLLALELSVSVRRQPGVIVHDDDEPPPR